MINKRFISIVLVLMFVLVILGGCKQVSNNESSTDSSTESSSDAADAVGSETEVSEPVKLRIMAGDCPEPEASYANNPPVLQELQKRTNVVIEWELATGENYTTLVKTRVAAGADLPDIIQNNLQGQLTTDMVMNLGKQGIIIPLNDLIDKHAPNIKKWFFESYPSISKKNTMADGNIYYVGNLVGNIQHRFSTLNIRKDWLDALGMEIPETVDEFYNAIKAMRDKDANENGKKDEVITQPWGPGVNSLFNNLPQAFGVKRLEQSPKMSWYADDNGNVYNTILTPEMKNFLEFMNKMFVEGIIDNEIFNTSWEIFNEKCAANQIAAVGNAMWASWFAQIIEEKSGANAVIVPLKPLKGPDGSCGIYLNDFDYGNTWMITRDCANPEAAIKFLDYCVSPEGSILIYYGFEGADWVKSNMPDAGVFDVEYSEQWHESMEKDPKYQAKQGQNCLALPIVLINSDDFVIRDADDNKNSADREYLKKFLENLHESSISAYNEAVPTEEEVKELEAISADLWLYMEEMINKFVTGNEPLTKWDDFVSECKSLGIDEVTAIHQKLYDRYKNLN